ncbi:hypothetical protein LTR04_005989 [Oleoguttula sp. CCFEE 6159]|nr:hypothetical protein LTR04_005989 [Oleoguttula sp. CCFEE 6159]
MWQSAAKSFYLAVFVLLGTSHAATSSRPSSQDVCAIRPGAIVSDTCASFATLDTLNKNLQPYVRSLTSKSDFFSYYRLNLYDKECPFWSDEGGLCGNIACAVNTLENEEDIPAIWRSEELGKLEGPKAHHPGKKQQQERQQKPLMGELGEDVGESCVVEYDDECDDRDYCVPEDVTATAKGDYVSLVDNPERFTGYGGSSAHQVWEAIYRENCFSKPRTPEQSVGVGASGSSPPFGGFSGLQGQAAQDLRSVMKEHGRHQALDGTANDPLDFEDECLEKRVFYRVISGMHASISTHLCWDYLNQTTGNWGPNLACYERRLHEYPERISNLYFNYALVLRAVGKLRDYVQDYTFCSGDPIEDRRTKQMVITLADNIPAGPQIFDESIMFQDNDSSVTGISLKEDFRNRFRNVSRIMDCVGCDKCRLWGKLQTAGYGTALKVLFELGQEQSEGQSKPLLRRTELVALVNTLDKISHSLSAVAEFRKMIEARDEGKILVESPEKVRKMSESQMPPADSFDELDDLEVDDDYQDSEQQAPTESIGDVFWDEYSRVWKAWKFVMRSWFSMPGKLSRIFIMELSRLWKYWLGDPVPPRSWEFRYPRHDEI